MILIVSWAIENNFILGVYLVRPVIVIVLWSNPLVHL